jgi:hypothetical protein
VFYLCGQERGKAGFEQIIVEVRCLRSLYFIGAPGPTRTGDLRIRSPTLYPAELRAPLFSLHHSIRSAIQECQGNFVEGGFRCEQSHYHHLRLRLDAPPKTQNWDHTVASTLRFGYAVLEQPKVPASDRSSPGVRLE